MADKMLNVKGELIQSGVFPGLPNQQVPLWVNSNNIVFKDASAKVSGAHTPLFDKGSNHPGTGILALDNLGSPALVWGDRVGLYRGLVSPSTEDITRVSGPYTGTEDNPWSIVQFGQTILATNGVDPVQYFGDINAAPGTKFVDIDTVSDLPTTFTTKILLSTGAYILAFNTDNEDTEYRWHDEDDVLMWQPSASNSARDLQIRDMGSDIVCVRHLGKLLVIYGRDQLHVVGFTSAPIYFPNEHLMSGVGAVGKNAVVPVGRKHYGFSHTGLFVMDGSDYDYIDDPAMHKYIYQERYDYNKPEQVVSWSDENEGMVYWSFPVIDGGGTSVAFNYRTGAWSLFDWYRTAASTGGLWGSPVMVDQLGQVWLQGSSSSALVSPGVPLGMSDELNLSTGYGMLGYGEVGYGAVWSAD